MVQKGFGANPFGNGQTSMELLHYEIVNAGNIGSRFVSDYFFIHDSTYRLRIHGSRTDHQVHSGIVKVELWSEDEVYVDIGSRLKTIFTC